MRLVIDATTPNAMLVGLSNPASDPDGNDRPIGVDAVDSVGDHIGHVDAPGLIECDPVVDEAAGRASTAQAYMVPGTVEAARAALSSTELEQATLAGSTLTMDSAVAFALERLDKVAAS